MKLVYGFPDMQQKNALKIDLSSISSLLKSELAEFNKLYKSSMKSSVGVVDLVTNYILKQKGKKIRPLLVLLSSKLAGGINERSYRGAILVELLHSATLVHDDVVDDSSKRRGFPSINAIWKNKVAVLIGDYLLAKGLMLSVEDGDYDFLGIVSKTVKRMAEGELLQAGKSRKLNIDEETYYRIISDKTASLLSTCCEIGANSSTEDPELRRNLKEFGENLGIAFQIRDDILDYVGKTKLFGKVRGGDIKDKKITLPLIYALREAEEKKAKQIIKSIKKGPDNGTVNEIIEFVISGKGIDYAEEMSQVYADKAKQNLSAFPDSEAKESLCNLVQFVIQREK